jgi:hypothetical protein
LAEVAGVVEVQVEVDVVGPDAHADAVFFEQVEWGQRPEMLADGEGRDANEADEVGQGGSSRGAGISLVEGEWGMGLGGWPSGLPFFRGRNQHSGNLALPCYRGLAFYMRRLSFSIVLLCLWIPTLVQSQQTDEALLAKTRDLYDAPFTRGLVSFDCAVQFDWKSHFIETIGQVPPEAVPTLERLHPIEHRIFVDRSGAVVSEIPKKTDLTGIPHGADLEGALQAVVSSGLNAWGPFGTNVILPVRPTKFTFQKEDTGYKLMMSGTNVEATLVLDPSMRITVVVSHLPQPLRFATEFVSGSDGYLLRSVKTSSDVSSDAKWESSFTYEYQKIQGFELPSVVTVTQEASGETWRYSLNDCKAVAGISINVEAPKR